MEVAELKKAFGRRVQELREQRGWTQEHLAEAIDRTVDTVSNIERGANSTRVEIAARLAGALGVELPELFEFAPHIDELRGRRRQITRLARSLSDLDDRTLTLVLDLVGTALALVKPPTESV